MKSYVQDRDDFYKEIPAFWPDLYGEEYALYDISVINQKELESIRQCTERAGKIFFKVCELLRIVQDEILLEMGFPKETLTFLRLKTISNESVIARLDLIKYNNTFKCIEINSDTPTFIMELFHVNGRAANHFGFADPNKGMEDNLANSIQSAIGEASKWVNAEDPYIVFTAHDDNIEDKNTVQYLKTLYRLPAAFIPLHRLRIEPDIGLFDGSGRKIDILYRQTFPIENLIMDEDQEGNLIGKWLLDLVQKRKLSILNPPSAFLLQNKAIMAVIWGLHERGNVFFTEEEHSWIKEYFIATFFEADIFIQNQLPYVKKPIFGREGDTVQIFDPTGSLLIEEHQKTYSHIPSIYQQFAPLPQVSYQSAKGSQNGHLLIGSFLINGKASSIGFRVGGEITNNLSCFLPAGLAKE